MPDNPKISFSHIVNSRAATNCPTTIIRRNSLQDQQQHVASLFSHSDVNTAVWCQLPNSGYLDVNLQVTTVGSNSQCPSDTSTRFRARACPPAPTSWCLYDELSADPRLLHCIPKRRRTAVTFRQYSDPANRPTAVSQSLVDSSVGEPLSSHNQFLSSERFSSGWTCPVTTGNNPTVFQQAHFPTESNLAPAEMTDSPEECISATNMTPKMLRRYRVGNLRNPGTHVSNVGYRPRRYIKHANVRRISHTGKLSQSALNRRRVCSLSNHLNISSGCHRTSRGRGNDPGANTSTVNSTSQEAAPCIVQTTVANNSHLQSIGSSADRSAGEQNTVNPPSSTQPSVREHLRCDSLMNFLQQHTQPPTTSHNARRESIVSDLDTSELSSPPSSVIVFEPLLVSPEAVTSTDTPSQSIQDRPPAPSDNSSGSETTDSSSVGGSSVSHSPSSEELATSREDETSVVTAVAVAAAATAAHAAAAAAHAVSAVAAAAAAVGGSGEDRGSSLCPDLSQAPIGGQAPASPLGQPICCYQLASPEFALGSALPSATTSMVTTGSRQNQVRVGQHVFTTPSVRTVTHPPAYGMNTGGVVNYDVLPPTIDDSIPVNSIHASQDLRPQLVMANLPAVGFGYSGDNGRRPTRRTQPLPLNSSPYLPYQHPLNTTITNPRLPVSLIPGVCLYGQTNGNPQTAETVTPHFMIAQHSTVTANPLLNNLEPLMIDTGPSASYQQPRPVLPPFLQTPVRNGDSYLYLPNGSTPVNSRQFSGIAEPTMNNNNNNPLPPILPPQQLIATNWPHTVNNPVGGTQPLLLTNGQQHHYPSSVGLGIPTTVMSQTQDVQLLFQFLNCINQRRQDAYSLPYYPSAMTATAGLANASVVTPSPSVPGGSRVAAAVTPPLISHHPPPPAPQFMPQLVATPSTIGNCWPQRQQRQSGATPLSSIHVPATARIVPLSPNHQAASGATVALMAAAAAAAMVQHERDQRQYNMAPNPTITAAAAPTSSFPVPILHAHLYYPASTRSLPHQLPPGRHRSFGANYCYHSHYEGQIVNPQPPTQQQPQHQQYSSSFHARAPASSSRNLSMASPAYLATLFPFLVAVPSTASAATPSALASDLSTAHLLTQLTSDQLPTSPSAPLDMSLAHHLTTNLNRPSVIVQAPPAVAATPPAAAVVAAAAAAAAVAAAAAAATAADSLYQQLAAAAHFTVAGDALGSLHRGLTRQELESLPLQKAGETGNSSSTDDCCMICLDDYECGQTLRVLCCLHRFHTTCVDRWLANRRTCPLCRADAYDGSQRKDEA